MRNYKKKSSRHSWTDGQMQLALNNVLQGKSCQTAAIEFGVPRTTLQDRLKSINNPLHNQNDIKTGNFIMIFVCLSGYTFNA